MVQWFIGSIGGPGRKDFGMTRNMDQLAECVGCGTDILPLCISETRKAHYSCSICNAGFVVDLANNSPAVVMREPNRLASCGSYELHRAHATTHAEFPRLRVCVGNIGETITEVTA